MSLSENEMANSNIDQDLKKRMAAKDIMVGTFVKTPSYELVEVLAKSKLDFIALDAEHVAFDRGRLDMCLAIARALSFPTLVRVPSGEPWQILNALDSGATGVIVPHIDSVEKAKAVVKSCRFGHGGRGYAGSTRWAGFATRPMAQVLEQSKTETIVVLQIEEPEGVDAIDEIAALDGVDGIFVGPADLAVCYGTTDQNAPIIRDALAKVGKAAKANRKTLMTFAPNAQSCQTLSELGVTMFYIGSDHSFMLKSANDTANAITEKLN
jgi:2-keto-3-deoxy-L-rhamnonate aldolase RhmA